jgi:hypothetical protein
MQVDKFKKELLEKAIDEIYRSYLTDSDVWYFRNKATGNEHYGRYDAFKQYMAAKLEIHMGNIAIVGSAKLGFSLSPDKAFRPFHEVESDIDVVIVSDTIFRKSWDAFLDLHKKTPLRSYKQTASEIFRRFVTLKSPNTSNAFFDEWSRKVDPCKRDLQLIFDMPNEINYRIYDSWDSVQEYHKQGLAQLKKNLESQNESNN